MNQEKTEYRYWELLAIVFLIPMLAISILVNVIEKVISGKKEDK